MSEKYFYKRNIPVSSYLECSLGQLTDGAEEQNSLEILSRPTVIIIRVLLTSYCLEKVLGEETNILVSFIQSGPVSFVSRTQCSN